MNPRIKKILDGISKNQRIANGYLFCEGDNRSKKEAAKYFAKSLNCKGSPSPCEKCESCIKADKNIHPDIIVIEKDNASFKIEQIREIKELTKFGPSWTKWKVVIINEADTMTTAAANAFLKSLEEPSPNVVFILISEREGNLPKTIESRCQKLTFGDPEKKEAREDVQNVFEKIRSKKFNYIEESQVLSEYEGPEAKEFLKDFFVLLSESKMIKEAKEVLSTLKGLENKGNTKLGMDLLCYKLWKTN